MWLALTLLWYCEVSVIEDCEVWWSLLGSGLVLSLGVAWLVLVWQVDCVPGRGQQLACGQR